MKQSPRQRRAEINKAKDPLYYSKLAKKRKNPFYYFTYLKQSDPELLKQISRRKSR